MGKLDNFTSYSSFKLNKFVSKEANIWAWIYRSINRKKDNNEYDEENEDSKMLLEHSFKFAETQAFKDFTYRRKNDLIKQLDFNKYQEEVKEDNDENKSDTNKSSPRKLELRPSNDSDSSQDDGSLHAPSLYKKSSSSNKHIPRVKDDYLTPLHHNRAVSVPKLNLLSSEVEELLVIYYVSAVIRLSKFSDALKAINEYKKKKSLSKSAQAHMYKILGVLSMVNEKKDYKKAKKYFKKSIEKFVDLNWIRGNAIAQLALLRCEWEIAFNKDFNIRDLTKAISEADESIQWLSKLDYPEIVARAKVYSDWIKHKLNGDNIGNFRKTLKSKSIKKKILVQSPKEDTLLNSDVLQDEDIKLYVEVVEQFENYDNVISIDECKSQTPQTEIIKTRKNFKETKYKDKSDSDVEGSKPRKFKMRNRLGSGEALKAKLNNFKKFPDSKSKERRKETTPLIMGRFPSIITSNDLD